MQDLGASNRPLPVHDPEQRVDVKRAFLCLFRQQGWAMTALMGSLFMFIPVVGPIAFQGYTVRVLKHMVMTGDDRSLPRLDGFGDLMGMGVMPFLLSMIWSFPLVFVVYGYIGVATVVVLGVSLGSGAILSAAGLSADASAAVALVLAIVTSAVAVILMYAIILLISYPMQAINTMVELTGKIDYAWNFQAVRRYLSVLRPEYRRGFVGMILGNLVIVTVVLLVSLLSLGILYLPALMVMVVCMGIAAAHLQAQLYRIYLARGGEPLPMDPRL